jgi:hypothetical protein
VPNACKSNAAPSGAAWRTAEEHVATCPAVGDNGAKAPLIPHVLVWRQARKAFPAPREGAAAHQVVGGVMAHQADDGLLVCEDNQPDWD